MQDVDGNLQSTFDEILTSMVDAFKALAQKYVINQYLHHFDKYLGYNDNIGCRIINYKIIL